MIVLIVAVVVIFWVIWAIDDLNYRCKVAKATAKYNEQIEEKNRLIKLKELEELSKLEELEKFKKDNPQIDKNYKYLKDILDSTLPNWDNVLHIQFSEDTYMLIHKPDFYKRDTVAVLVNKRYLRNGKYKTVFSNFNNVSFGNEAKLDVTEHTGTIGYHSWDRDYVLVNTPKIILKIRDNNKPSDIDNQYCIEGIGNLFLNFQTGKVTFTKIVRRTINRYTDCYEACHDQSIKDYKKSYTNGNFKIMPMLEARELLKKSLNELLTKSLNDEDINRVFLWRSQKLKPHLYHDYS